MKGRFAPSPTGRMHLGNIYSALLSWLSIRQKGGEWVLRIEDIDRGRSRKEYADQILDDLRWLGLTWDEIFVQSERFDIYERELRKITNLGKTYPCYCTRADLLAANAPHESDGRIVYQGTCRPDSLGGTFVDTNPSRPHAVRVVVPDENISFTDGHYGAQSVNLAKKCGDFVLQRKDGGWAYQLAVVVDDALMGISEVVRGRDLLLSVPQQIYLYRLLGYTSPEFFHVPLLCNQEGQRLSKRDKSLDLNALRDKFSAEEIIGKLASYAGIIEKEESVSAAELISEFSWNKIPLDDIIL